MYQRTVDTGHQTQSLHCPPDIAVSTVQPSTVLVTSVNDVRKQPVPTTQIHLSYVEILMAMKALLALEVLRSAKALP